MEPGNPAATRAVVVHVARHSLMNVPNVGGYSSTRSPLKSEMRNGESTIPQSLVF